MRAIPSQDTAPKQDASAARPPREDLLRSVELGFREDASAGPVLFGHLVVFDEWAEITSAYEGHFFERFAAGSAQKTIAEQRARMRVLFDHGRDPSIGNKVLGPIDVLEEQDIGVYYEVPLLETAYVRELLPGLAAGQYGASVRMKVFVDDVDYRPTRSSFNPRGIPQRTIREFGIREFGPVTFAAYVGASAGVRSLTDDFLLERLSDDRDHFQAFVERLPEGMSARSEDRLYERTGELVGDSVWAIHPPALQTILAILAERQAGDRPSREEIAERIGSRDDSPTEPDPPHVAVLPIRGPILPRAGLLAQLSSGATSIVNIQRDFRAALADPAVSAIVLDIDSPGGSVDLVPELASEIMAARGQKPIVAVANAMAASAAYWIATAADELVVTPSGQVGSVGVYSAHEDVSVEAAMAGVKTTLVSAGEHKVEANPFEPLSKEARAEMQRRVDAYYSMFVDALAAQRGTTASAVEADFGQGRVVMAKEAVSRGMADRVGTLAEVLAEVERAAEPEPVESPEIPTPELVPFDAAQVGTSTSPSTLERKETPSWRL